ncbi:exosome complex component CSL4-like isoform X1 [Oncorhynchus kisutch]|uniref:exosome complex component CSL4 isoform X1 n=1 Tax=Oncorhynchus kisutch TaxID=8019 RepID=UPI0012DE571F|nr:exosome complex component CSL4-like isoform X1 [Oncorhynchus kisutch]XP_031674484.1 exosome complex component CSL4-like isoform X1 [Oncorhynchus kisutch]
MSPMKLCVPGDRLCSTEDCMPGTGVYLRHGYIYSSLAGYVLRKNEGEELPVISVVRETEAQLLPDVGAIVTCKVTSINPRFAKVHILYVGSTPLKDRFRGTIRKEDVRATEKDRVETYKSFRPGDIVLAKVISLGDVQSNYLLTTAENELGVVVAHSEAGAQMVSISSIFLFPLLSGAQMVSISSICLFPSSQEPRWCLSVVYFCFPPLRSPDGVYQ